ncbi:MAG: HEAT repeat domain-containing protein, partial [Candidatus Omnitrophota bacterium]
ESAQKDVDKEVRKKAVYALKRNSKDEITVPTLKLVIKNDKDTEVRIEALDALREIIPEEAVTIAVEIIRDNSEKKEVKLAAIDVIAKDPENSLSIITLQHVAGQQDADMELRLSAIRRLASMGKVKPDAFKAVVGLAKSDPNPQVRIAAIMGLSGENSENDLTIPTLDFVAQKDLEVAVRVTALNALGRIGTVGAVKIIVERVKNDLDKACRIAAVNALAINSKNELTIPTIEQVAKQDGDEKVREAAMEALGAIGTSETINLLTAIASDPNEQESIRIVAIEVLGKVKNVEVVNFLIGLIRSETNLTLRKKCLVVLSGRNGNDFINNPSLNDKYPSIVKLYSVVSLISKKGIPIFNGSSLLEAITSDQKVEELTKDLGKWLKYENNFIDLLSFTTLNGGQWSALGLNSERGSALVREIIKSGVPNYVNTIENWLELSNLHNEFYQPFSDFMTNVEIDLNLRMKLADDYLEIVSVDSILRIGQEGGAFKEDLVKTFTQTRDELNKIIGDIVTLNKTSSAKRKSQERSEPFMENLRKSFLRYILGRELSSNEIALLKNAEVSKQVFTILSVLAKLNFSESVLMRQVAKDFFNVLFLEYDEANPDALAIAKGKLNTFIMEFTQENLTKSNSNNKQLEKSNKETIDELVAAGYSRDLWSKGVEFTTNIKEGITEEKKRKSIKQASFEMVEIAIALGVKSVNGQEVTLEKAGDIDNYEKAKKFLEGLKVSGIQIPEEREDRLEDIVHYIERKEAEPIIPIQEEATFNVVVKKDFLKEASAGRGVPGCFNPNGVHKEMPIMHAMEANAGFIQVYNESGRQVANAVIVYAKEGAYVYSGYNSSSYDMDYIFGRALAELARYVPRLVLQPGAAGYEYLSSYGHKSEEQLKLVKSSTIFKKQYYDSGGVDGEGNLTVTVENPVIVTAGGIEAKGGFKELESKPKEVEAKEEEKKEELTKPDIDFQKLASMFLDTITEYQVNKAGGDWGKVLEKMRTEGWGQQVSPTEIKLNPNIDSQAESMSKAFEGELWPTVLQPLTEKRYKKYLFIITLLKKKVVEEGRMAVDQGYYLWVNERMKEKFKRDFNIVETDQIADLMIDFLDQQKWPMDILTARADAAMNTLSKSKEVMGSKKGGIDFTPANMNLQTKNNGVEIKFHLDPAMLAQLQNASGFVPVIMNIKPMTDLKLFLGMKQDDTLQPLAVASG